jgi:putative oxidoreductase
MAYDSPWNANPDQEIQMTANTLTLRDADLQSVGAGLLRIALGVMFVAHAALKIFVFTLPGTAGFFASQGFPAWSAYPVVGIELLGGIALILGLHTRLVAALTLPVLLGALYVHAGNGWVFSNANGGWEYPLLLVVLDAIVLLQGAGALALSAPRLKAHSVTSAA